MSKALAALPQLDIEPFVAHVPGSKSLTNRALILAAQRPGRTRILNGLHCDDTLRLAAALDAFGGLSVSRSDEGFTVERSGERLTAPSETLDLGAAGTPARLLLSFAASAEGATVITGTTRLCGRPMGDLLDSLHQIGIRSECLEAQGCLPVRVWGSPVTRDHWRVNGRISSQFVSSLLLLAAQRPGGPVTLTVEGKIVSRPYIEMTVKIMRDCGIPVQQIDQRSFVVTPAVPSSGQIKIEPDASGLSYFLAAAAITRQSVMVEHIGSSSAQGDVGFARLLKSMGCDLELEPDRITLTGGWLRGVEVDMQDMPDVVLTLAAIAPWADTATKIRNIANLRVKESDRIHAAVQELHRLGVSVQEGPDWMRIEPAETLKAEEVETYDDHRVAMAFGVLRLIDKHITIKDPDCVAKSFPGFWAELDRFQRYHQSNPRRA